MSHEKIQLQNPYELYPPQDDEGRKASELWRPQGLKIQWGPYGESDGSPAVGIGVGQFNETEADMERISKGGGKLEDLMMLWFNRSQVNHVIRTLRRARTGAYGADE